MSFGRRLAFFFVLLVIVPMLALVSMLLFVSDDARRGKADARLAAGVETVIALYGEDIADGRDLARRIAREPEVASALAGDDRAKLRALVGAEAASAGAERVEILDPNGGELAAAGSQDAIAFGVVRLNGAAGDLGTVRASAADAEEFTAQAKHLTNRELVFTRAGAPIAATVSPPESIPPPGETVDLSVEQGDYRAREQVLDSDGEDAALVLGPRKEGGLLAIGRPAALLLVGLLLLAVAAAWTLARALSALHQRVEALALTDPLTGVWNRRRMGELLEREFERQRRFVRPFALLIVDVDDFKSINDEHGHPQGDAVLRHVADVLQSETRTIDEVVRFGGDEFAVVLSETRLRGATALAERLCERVRVHDLPLSGGGFLRATVSVGVAAVPECANEADKLVQAADDALLRAKRSGKDQVNTAPVVLAKRA